MATNNQSPFDQIKYVAENGIECWKARDISKALQYESWDSFESVIYKAQISCMESGTDIGDHFVDVEEEGTGRRDVVLSRKACYLLAMNANPSKRVVAEAQQYFTERTLLQDSEDQFTEDQKRIILRDRVRDGNIILKQAAHERGVENFGAFQNAGYRGLYNGHDVNSLRRLKGIPQKDQILDRMGREELAANEFRITQTEKLLNNGVAEGEEDATNLHNNVGKKVRSAIKEIGGTMPEELPAEQHINELATKPSNKALMDSLKTEAAPPERLKRPSVSPTRANSRWNAKSRVVIVGVSGNTLTEDGSGYQHFANLEAAREIFPDLDTHRGGKRFSAAMGNPAKDVMRFETWTAYDYYEAAG